MREPEIVIRYRTSDGELFSHKPDARKHEKKILNLEIANEMLNEGKSIGEILRRLGHACIDPLLDKVTKDSMMCIQHWQCSDEAMYKIQRFGIGMNVYLHGNASPWSVGYGDWISIETLVRYAENKKSKI